VSFGFLFFLGVVCLLGCYWGGCFVNLLGNWVGVIVYVVLLVFCLSGCGVWGI